jgi:hypothetical protein
MRPDPAPPFQRVGIVGLGLIGGSIALRARRQWPSIHVAGIDHDTVLESAVARGVIDESRQAIGIWWCSRRPCRRSSRNWRRVRRFADW